MAKLSETVEVETHETHQRWRARLRAPAQPRLRFVSGTGTGSGRAARFSLAFRDKLVYGRERASSSEPPGQ